MSSLASAQDLVQEAEDMKLGMLRFTKTETDRKHRAARSFNRVSLLSTVSQGGLLAPLFFSFFFSAHTLAACLVAGQAPDFKLNRFGNEVQCAGEKFVNRYVIRCDELKFKLEEIEPFFCTMALYDHKVHIARLQSSFLTLSFSAPSLFFLFFFFFLSLQTKRRISENFYFDLNSDQTLAMLGDAKALEDAARGARQAVFSVSSDPTEVFLVVRIDKVLEGDPSKVMENYARVLDDKQKEDKIIEKIKSSARQFCQRLGRYTMPFAWAAIVLEDAVACCRGDLAPSVEMELHQQLTGSSKLHFGC